MIEISGLEINPFKDINQALKKVFSDKGAVIPGFAVAINPEKIMILRNDNKFKNILNYASIRYADGIGIVWALKKKR